MAVEAPMPTAMQATALAAARHSRRRTRLAMRRSPRRSSFVSTEASPFRTARVIAGAPLRYGLWRLRRLPASPHNDRIGFRGKCRHSGAHPLVSGLPPDNMVDDLRALVALRALRGRRR